MADLLAGVLVSTSLLGAFEVDLWSVGG